MEPQSMNIKLNESIGTVLVYGGNGALGSKCISTFKSHHYKVIAIDSDENHEADFNIKINVDDDLTNQENSIIQIFQEMLGDDEKLDAIVCAAGGWIGGNAEKDLTAKAELLWRYCVWPSLISTHIAVKFLKQGGLFILTGAKVALDATPSMIGYGLSKAAVHQLVKSLAAPNSGIPSNVLVVGLLPVILDTPANRQSMPSADFSTWTSLQFVSDLILSWIMDKNKPKNGSLLQLITKNFNTDLVVA